MRKWLIISLILLVAILSTGCQFENDEPTVIKISEDEISQLEETAEDEVMVEGEEDIQLPLVPEKPIGPPKEGGPLPNRAILDELAKLSVGVLKGPSGMGMSYLMAQDDQGELQIDYDFTVLGAPDQLAAKFVAGEVQIAAMPTNLAANLFQKTKGDVQLLGVNTYGVLYIVERGNSVGQIKDLKGKSFIASGMGATPEYLMDYMVTSSINNKKEKPKIDFLNEHSEVASKLLAGDADLALLPEPFVSMVMAKDPDIRIAIDLNKEWTRATKNKGLPMGCIVVNKTFAEDFPMLVRAFQLSYAASVKYVNTNPEEASTWIKKFGVLEDQNIAEQAIPRSGIVWVAGERAKNSVVTYLQQLYDLNPKSIGGAMPDDTFYYEIQKRN